MMCLVCFLSLEFSGLDSRMVWLVIWRMGARTSVICVCCLMVASPVGGVEHHGMLLYTVSFIMLNDIFLFARPALSKMMSSLLLLMMERTILCPTEQVDLRSKIFQNLIGSLKVLLCNHSISFGRVDLALSVQTRMGFSVDKAYWFDRNTLCYDDLQNPDIQVVSSFGNSLCYLTHCTGPVNGAPRTMMKRPSACSNFWVMMSLSYHVNAI